MRINNNISALNAWRNLLATDFAMGKSLERLSSGYRINRAADDAAGLAISEKMRGQIRGLNQAIRNAQDAISLIQTAEGALNETHSILQRMRELANQAANDTNTDADRFEIQKEINQLKEELTRIGDTTEFNTKKLLNGKFSGVFHIGANEDQTMSVSISDMRADALKVVADTWVATYDIGTTNMDTSKNNLFNLKGGTYYVEVAADGTVTLKDVDGNTVGMAKVKDAANTVTMTIAASFRSTEATGNTVVLGINDTNTSTGVSGTGLVGAQAGTVTVRLLAKGQGISVMSQDDAEKAVTAIQAALDRVSAQRSNLGAVQNRLEHTINNLSVAAENLSAAESRIRDVDMAQEMVIFTRNQILLQAGTAMLAQANTKPQAVLQLLR